MTREVKETITCDTCADDISPKYTSYPRDDILQVTCMNVALHSENSPIYAIAMKPMLIRPLHFCGIKCMKGYEEKK